MANHVAKNEPAPVPGGPPEPAVESNAPRALAREDAELLRRLALGSDVTGECVRRLVALHHAHCPNLEDPRLLVQWSLDEDQAVDPEEMRGLVVDVFAALDMPLPDPVEEVADEPPIGGPATGTTEAVLQAVDAMPPAGAWDGAEVVESYVADAHQPAAEEEPAEEVRPEAAEPEAAKAEAPTPPETKRLLDSGREVKAKREAPPKKAAGKAKAGKKQAPPAGKDKGAPKLGIVTETELHALARKLTDGAADPMDVLRAGLAYHLLQPTAFSMRAQDSIIGLLHVARECVEMCTSLAEHHGIQLDGNPVVTSRDYLEWPHARLRRLVGLLDARVSQALADGRRGEEATREAARTVAALRSQVEAAKQRAEEVAAGVEEERARQRENALRLNNLLAGYVDQETCVVAQLDPVTNRPLRYVRVEETAEGETLRSVDTLAKSSKFPSWETANGACVRLMRRQRERVQRGLAKGVQPVFAVMQLSLRPVKAEDL